MEQDLIDRQCGLMSVPELVRSLTVETGRFSEEFRQAAKKELAQRGTSLEECRDQIEGCFNNGGTVSCTIEQALARLDETPLWTAWTFSNFLKEESLVLQRENLGWTVHHYRENEYARSFFIQKENGARELLAKFLRLEDWEDLVVQEYDLDKWQALVKTKAFRYVRKVEGELYKAGIPYTVQPPLFSRDPKGRLAVLVPDEGMDAGCEVLAEIEKQVGELYRRAEELAERGEPEKELEIYELLAEIVPDKPEVPYNRGSVLFELGRCAAAADSFIEAVSLGMDEAGMEVSFNPARGRPGVGRAIGGMGRMFGQFGALLGLVGLLFDRSRPEKEAVPEYPDFVDDAEMFLLRILDKMPEETRILHCLAAISRLRNDLEGAEERYRRILAVDPEDGNALLHLNHLRVAAGEE